MTRQRGRAADPANCCKCQGGRFNRGPDIDRVWLHLASILPQTLPNTGPTRPELAGCCILRCTSMQRTCVVYHFVTRGACFCWNAGSVQNERTHLLRKCLPSAQ